MLQHYEIPSRRNFFLSFSKSLLILMGDSLSTKDKMLMLTR